MTGKKLVAQVGEDTIVTIESAPHFKLRDRITVEIDRGDVTTIYEIRGHIERRTERNVDSSDGTV